jgi:hypothetical protein
VPRTDRGRKRRVPGEASSGHAATRIGVEKVWRAFLRLLKRQPRRPDWGRLAVPRRELDDEQAAKFHV